MDPKWFIIGNFATIAIFINNVVWSFPQCNPPCLYYSNKTAINFIELQTNHTSTVISDLRHAVALEVDFLRNQLFWSDVTERVIKKINLTSGHVTAVVAKDLGQVEGLAIDWVGEVLYWTDYRNERIEVARFDGSDRMVLLSENHENPKDIAVDIHSRLIFWTDWSPIEPRIERATMSGENRTVIIKDSKVVHWPIGIAVDHSQNALFWVDAYYEYVVTCDFFGGNINVLAQSTYPFGITTFGGALYWSDINSSTIYTRFKNSLSTVSSFGKLSTDGVYALAVLDSTTQQNVQHSCYKNNGGCSYLCLLRPGGYSCACPDHIQTDRPCEQLFPSRSQSSSSINSVLGINTSLISLKSTLSALVAATSPVSHSSSSVKHSIYVMNAFPSSTALSSVVISSVLPFFPDSTLSSSSRAVFSSERAHSNPVTLLYIATFSAAAIQPSPSASPGLRLSFSVISSSAPQINPTKNSTLPFPSNFIQKAKYSTINSNTFTPSMKVQTVTSTSPFLNRSAFVSLSQSQTASLKVLATTTQNPQILRTCNTLPCMNGGTCVQNGPEEYNCNCIKGYAGKNCLFYVGNNTITITFKMTIDEWQEDIFKKSISKVLTTFCHKHGCSFHNRSDSVQTATKRDIHPIVFYPGNILILGQPKALSETVIISTSVIAASSHSEMLVAVPRLLLCRFARDSRDDLSRLMGNHTILLINGESIPICGNDSSILSTVKPQTTKEISGSSNKSISYPEGVQTGLIIAVVAILAIGGFFVCYLRRRGNKDRHRTLRGDKYYNESAFENPCYDNADLASGQQNLAAVNWTEKLPESTAPEVFKELDFGCVNQLYGVSSFHISTISNVNNITKQKQKGALSIALPLTDLDHEKNRSKENNKDVASFVNPKYDFVEQLDQSSFQWKN